jgi:exodeoxyribonuclease V beta subunit
MMRLLYNVAHTPLEQVAPGFTLAQLSIARRRIEFEFLFPATIQVTQLAPLFAEYGYADLAMLIGSSSHLLPFEAYGHRVAERFVPSGYVRGFIDVVFEHAGRFWIIDWKSNDLGDQPADYGEDALQRAMVAHRYHVQASLYTLALHRYLQHYLPGYQYETHFGGYVYLFVRGMRLNWQYYEQACGIYAHKPDVQFIASLDSKIGR